MPEYGARQRHRFVIPIPPTYEMPLPARGPAPKYNPNLQRLRDIQAVSNYFDTLQRVNEQAAARGGMEYWDDDPLSEVDYTPDYDTLIKPSDYFLEDPRTGGVLYQGAKRGGRGGTGGSDKRSSGSSAFGGGRSGAAGTKKRFTVTQEIV